MQLLAWTSLSQFLGYYWFSLSYRIISFDAWDLKVESQAVEASRAAIDDVSIDLVKRILISNKYNLSIDAPNDFNNIFIDKSKRVLVAAGANDIEEIIKKYS